MRAPTVGQSYMIGAALVLAAVWWFTRKGNAQAAGAAVGGAAVNAGAGVVLGIGDAIGVPRTDPAACRGALLAGDTWAALKACPVGTLVDELFKSGPASPVPKFVDPEGGPELSPFNVGA